MPCTLQLVSHDNTLLTLQLPIWQLLRARSSLTFRQTIECGFTLKLVGDMIITYSQYVSPFKYTFCLKVSTTVPIKSVNDKHQITTTFTVSATVFFQFSYYTKVKTKDLYKNTNFQRTFTLFTLRSSD